MVEYICSGELWRSSFGVPAAIVDRFLNIASPAALKVLLLVLRSGESNLSAGDMAQKLRMSPQDVADALFFWEQQSVLIPTGDDHSTAAAAAPIPHSAPLEPAPPSPPPTPPTSKQSRPKLYAHDVKRLQENNPEIAFLLQESQRLMKNALTVLESECILTLRLYYNLPVESVLLLVAHWCGEDKHSLHQLESLGAACAEGGMRESRDISHYLEQLQNHHQQEQVIYDAFQITGRRLNTKERTYCRQWFQLNLSPQLIAFACEQTVLKIGKISFAYADKLLQVWSEQGVASVAEAQKEMAENAKICTQSKKSPKKKNQSTQTAGSSLDNQELEDFFNRDYA